MTTRTFAPRTPAGLAGVTEVVVPHDGSELAARAPPVADLLADRLGAWVSRVTVVPPGDRDEPSGYGVVPGVASARDWWVASPCVWCRTVPCRCS